jgi:uncharacterized protein
MTKQIWLNLPVKDVAKSKVFFAKIGFTFNGQNDTEHSACMMVGDKNFVIMLFEESIFAEFAQTTITDTKRSAEILISIDAENREEVDEFAEKVVAAGGILFAKPAENQGWMYGCAFADLDGHRWNVLYMDLTKKQH